MHEPVRILPVEDIHFHPAGGPPATKRRQAFHGTARYLFADFHSFFCLLQVFQLTCYPGICFRPGHFFGWLVIQYNNTEKQKNYVQHLAEINTLELNPCSGITASMPMGMNSLTGNIPIHMILICSVMPPCFSLSTALRAFRGRKCFPAG